MKNTVGAKVAIGVCALVMGIAVWAQPGQPDAPAVLPPMSAPKACRPSWLLPRHRFLWLLRLLSPPPPR